MYNNSGGQSGPSKGIRLSFLTQSDQTKFEQIFTQSAGQFGGNKVSAQVVSELLRRSNLDNDSLAKIWDLASIANAPHLSFPEFAVAMFLTSKKLTGQTLPASLPPNIREETELAMATIASTETSQPSQQLVNTSMSPQQFGMIPTQQQNMMTGMPPQQTGMMTGMPSQQTGIMTGMPPQQQQSMMTGMMPPQQTGMMTGMPPQQTGMMTGMMPQQTGMPQQFRPSLPNNYQAPIQRAMQTGYMPQQQATKPRLQNLDFAKKMMPNQNGVTNLLNPSLGTSEANKLSWKISPEDKQRYREIFHAWEGSGSGFMSGDTAKDVLTQSQLPPQDLMKIWNLADVENKGSLDVDEFAIAMHLVYRKLNGFEVPTVLPAELKPPSSVLKKFVLGRRPPPSVPKFSPQVQQEEEEEEDVYDDYTSSSRRKGPQSASSSRYASRYNEPDEADVLILEDLRRQISETKRTLDRMPVLKSNNTRFSSDASKYSLEELKEKIRRAQDDLTNASLNNPHFQKYTQNSDTLLDLLETEKSLQEEINYLCNRDIPVLARQLRGAAAELRDTKVRYSRKNDGTQDFMAFVQPSGPGGSITEGDRVRAKAKAMMAARKAGNKGSSTDAAYGLRRAEEEKEEADKKADAIERDMERSRTALLDMRGDLRYLEEMIAAQDLEDKKRFENNSQDLSYELRRFIEQLNNKPVEPSYRSGGYQSPSTTSSYQSSGYQSPAAVASPAVSSPKPKAPAARPRTAEEIKKEAERRVQERLAALQAKRNPAGSPRSVKPSVSKPDEAEVAAQQRLREAEREAQENLRQSVNQREETDRKNRELELERIRENDRLDRQRVEDDAERQRQEAQEEEKRREQEEQDFLERRRQVLAKEEADRQARFDAIRRDEEEAELKKQQQQQHKPEHKPEEASEATPPPPPSAPPASAAPVAPATPVESTPPPLTSTPLPISSTPTPPPAPAAPSVTPSTSSSNNPFAKLQGGSSQAEKPNEPAHKRVSYNPFAAFSAFSATKGGAKDESDSEEEDDGWGHDDSDDENEFPAAGSAKNLAGKLFSAMSKRENSGSLETVREVSSPKPNQNDTTIPPPPPPPPATNDSIPPPPPAPAAPVPPPAPMAPPAPSAPQQQQQASIGGGGDMRNALLSQIQSGKKLKKAVTNDRSASSIAGHVIGGNEPPVQHTPAPVQPMAAPEIAAPAPISAPLSSGGFLAELQARTTTSSNEASPAHEPAVVAAESEPRTKHDESLPEQEYIALWDYPGSGSDDLIFSQDDVILVRDNNDAEDWWFGTHEKTQKTGYFPRNYVQPKPEAAPELNIKAKALYDFEGPDGQGCLNLTMGDMITILVKENDDWWKAQSQDGQIGLVPVNYVEEL